MLIDGPLLQLAEEKNNEKRGHKHCLIDEGLLIEIVKAPKTDLLRFQLSPDTQLIQYYFAVGGNVQLIFSGGHYQRELPAEHSLLMYQPTRQLQFAVQLEANANLVCLFIHVRKLHSLFLHDEGALPFLEQESINQKFYEERPTTAGLGMVLSQLLNEAHLPSNENLYYQAKSLEILSFYFHRAEEDDTERCPFLLDEQKISKIRQAKHIVQDRMLDPPGLKDLAREVGLNEYQLKVGFKNVYGNTVYQHLTNYKMEHARRLLDKQDLRVNEVSDLVGYSNPSHFIVAFKRRFGVTPKKYLMSLREAH